MAVNDFLGVAHSGGHGDGYAYYLMARELWRYLHWWTIPVTGAFAAVTTWLSSWFGSRFGGD